MHMISLAPNHRPFFVWCDTDATTFAPNLELRPFVFDFCCFHCSFQFCLAYQTSFESARRPPSCNPPDVCSRPVGRSIPVFLLTKVGLLSRLHCGQGRTKWACGTSGSERRSTTACLPWAIAKYSNESHFHPKAVSRFHACSLHSGLHRNNNVMSVLIRTFARNRSPVVANAFRSAKV